MRVVAKIGGSLLDNEMVIKEVVKDITKLGKNHEVILVHGGGREVNRVAERLKIKQKWVGTPRKWRVTDKKTLELLKMVIGVINFHLTYLVNKERGKGIGINGACFNAILAKKMDKIEYVENGKRKSEWIGFTGRVKKINVNFFNFLLKNKFIPVVACLAQGYRDECLNVNGDELAGVLASQLQADSLIILTDTPGFLMNPKDMNSLREEISVSEAEALLKEGKIYGGMVAKLEGCIDACSSGVKNVMLADGRVKKPIFSAFKGKGTKVYL